MAPSAIHSIGSETTIEPVVAKLNLKSPSRVNYLLDRNIHKAPPSVERSDGNYIYLTNGRKIYDGTCGAAVSCLGHSNEEVKQAMIAQMNKNSYVNSLFFSTPVVDELAQLLIESTGERMARAFLINSGSEAMEAAVKLARQYFLEIPVPQTRRVNFISREHSYHGNTLGALSVSGHVARRALFEPLLSQNTYKVSSCNPYRQRLPGQSDAAFVAMKKAELEAKFQELGPDTIVAFVCEPVVGAALGCVPAVPGYLKAMKEVCEVHGALLILDEIMCGMGRSGPLHSWEVDGVVPDIQTIGKGLGGGYQPIAGILIGHKIVNALDKGTGTFMHGHTYQAHPITCAAALCVQKIIRRTDLGSNVKTQGKYLEKLLRQRLASHPNVGDIRGRGLFWGMELVEVKDTKEPFDPKLKVAQGVHDMAMTKYCISIYPGQGCVDGIRGDHLMLAPAYNVTKEEVDLIVDQTVGAIDEFFANLPMTKA